MQASIDEQSVRQRLECLLRSTSGDDQAELCEDMRQWDSFTHVTLIASAEKEFRVRLTTRDVHAMRSVADLVAAILTKATAE